MFCMQKYKLVSKRIKKKKDKSTKFELRSKIKINNFEKNPTNGGIPAIESKDIINSFVETCVPLK